MTAVEVVDQERTRELRRRVLRPELAPGDPLPGDELVGAVHLAAIDADGAVLGTCFVYPEPAPWLPDRVDGWHLRQMATDPEHRGRGIGGAVLDAAVRHVEARDAPLLWCSARATAAGFYERYGFVVVGAQFADGRGVPHRQMWRELSAPPVPSKG